MGITRWLAASAAVLGVLGGTSAPAAASGSVPAPPGTPTRPVLTAQEAAPFVPASYLGWSGPYAAPVADPWRPRPIETRRADFVVGRHGLATVQEAVNAAVTAGGTARRYIAIRPGTYTGTVFIPAGAPPLASRRRVIASSLIR